MSAAGIQIVHGPQLKPEPEKPGSRPPTTLNVGFRATISTIDRVAKAARAKGVLPADIWRSAVIAFLDQFELSAAAYGTEPLAPAPSAPVQPMLVDAWRGNGKADFAGGQALQRRREQRKAQGAQGERVVDKTPTR